MKWMDPNQVKLNNNKSSNKNIEKYNYHIEKSLGFSKPEDFDDNLQLNEPQPSKIEVMQKDKIKIKRKQQPVFDNQ